MMNVWGRVVGWISGLDGSQTEGGKLTGGGLGRHAIERYDHIRRAVNAMPDNKIDHALFELLLSAEGVRDEMRVYEDNSSLLMQLAHTGYYVRRIERLHIVLDAMSTQYGIFESSEKSEWRSALELERLERVKRYDEMLAACSTICVGISNNLNTASTFLFRDLGSSEQQEEALTLLKSAVMNYGEDILTAEEIDITKRIFESIVEHSGMTVVSLPSWLVMPFEFMSEFGLSRWGNDVYFPDYLDSIRFICEANVWSSLNHPHVAKFLGACHVGSRPLIVHERVRSLSENIREVKAREYAWHRVYEVALVLQYLHERGLAYGKQLSVENVFCAELEAKALLFGGDLVSWMSEKESVHQQPNETSVNTEVNQLQLHQSTTDLKSLCVLAVNCLLAFTSSNQESGNLGEDTIWHDSVPTTRPNFINEKEWQILTSMCEIDTKSNTAMLCAIERLREFIGITTEQDRICELNVNCLGNPDANWDIDSVTIPAINNRTVLSALQSCSSMISNGTLAQGIHLRIQDVYNQIKTMKEDSIDPSRVKQLTERFSNLLVKFYRHLNQATRSDASSLGWSVASMPQSRDQMTLLSLHVSIDRLIARFNLSKANEVHKWEPDWSKIMSHARLQRLSAILLQNKTTSVSESTVNWKRDEPSSSACDLEESSKSELEDELFMDDGELSQLSILPKWFVSPTEIEFKSFEEFSRGAFGSVHHGKWFETPVVVKRVFLEATKEEETHAQFLQEADTWFELNHINVIKMYGACHIGQPFFVCENASGGDLSYYLGNKKKDDMYEVWYSLLNAALGLQYLHAKGIVHADLKANNVLVGGDGIAKLADFGLSKSGRSASTGVNDGGARGAYRWKAPECLPWKGDSGQSATFASDVFSFAMLMIEVATGKVPWDRITEDKVVIREVKNGKLPPQPQEMEDSEWELIKKMCCFKPSERVTIDHVVVHLSSLLERLDMDRLWADNRVAPIKYVNRIVSRKGALLSLIRLVEESNESIASIARDHLVAVHVNRGSRSDRKEISALIDLLTCESNIVVKWAATIIGDLAAKNDANKVEITKCGGIDPLVALLRAGDEVQREKAAGALWSLAAYNDYNSGEIAKCGGIDPLVALIRNGNDIQKENAAGALMNLAANNNQNKDHIASSGGIDPLVAMVRDGNEVQKEKAAGTLAVLAAHNEQNKRMIASCGGIIPLVALLRDGNSTQKENSSGALANLATNSNNQVNIAFCGGISPLVALVRDGNDLQKERAAGALMNLAASKANQVEIALYGGISQLVALVRGGNDLQKEKAAGALGNLAVNNDNKMEIGLRIGIGPLVELVRSGNSVQKVKAAGALWNLAYKNPNAIVVIRVCGAINPLLSMVVRGTDCAKLRASGTLAFLVPDAATRATIIMHGGIQALLILVRDACNNDDREEGLVAIRNLCCSLHDCDIHNENRVSNSFIGVQEREILSQVAESGSRRIQQIAREILSNLNK